MEVGITIKVSKYLLLSNQLKQDTRNISCVGYCYNSKPNACTNKAFSSKSTRFNPYFDWYKICMQTH